MMAPIYRQLAAIFQQITVRAESVALRFQSKGAAGSPQLVGLTSLGPYAVTIPSDATCIEMKLSGGGGGGPMAVPRVAPGRRDLFDLRRSGWWQYWRRRG